MPKKKQSDFVPGICWQTFEPLTNEHSSVHQMHRDIQLEVAKVMGVSQKYIKERIKMTKKEQKIVELLKTGNFTLHYWDNGECTLYKGMHDEEELGMLTDKAHEEIIVAEFDNVFEGYLSKEVELLVAALGGQAGSI